MFWKYVCPQKNNLTTEYVLDGFNEQRHVVFSSHWNKRFHLHCTSLVSHHTLLKIFYENVPIAILV